MDEKKRHALDAAKKMMALHDANIVNHKYAPPPKGLGRGPAERRSRCREVTIGEKWPDGTQVQLSIATDGTGIFLKDRASRTIMLNRSEVIDLLRELNKEFILDQLGGV